jgi:hypothetical protein
VQDPKCFQAKLDAHVKKAIAANPKLVQISTAYGQPKDDNAVIPRSKCVEVRQDKPQRKELPDWPEYKTCKYTTDAIVTEGTEKGETKRVCADPECSIHNAKRQQQHPCAQDDTVSQVRHGRAARLTGRLIPGPQRRGTGGTQIRCESKPPGKLGQPAARAG